MTGKGWLARRGRVRLFGDDLTEEQTSEQPIWIAPTCLNDVLSHDHRASLG